MFGESAGRDHTRGGLMNTRRTIALPAAIMALALFTPPVHGQGRGMRGLAGGARSRSSIRIGGRVGLARAGRSRFANEYPYLFPPYLYADDELDYGQGEAEAPVQYVLVQAAPAPAPAAAPVDALVLENQNGQWVRVPSGNQAPVKQAAGKADSIPGSGNPH